MHFRASVLMAAAASLINIPLAAALPTTERVSGTTLSARDDTQCDASTNFYVCHLNNFRGCCSVDPCALTEGCPDNKDDSNNTDDDDDDDDDDDENDNDTEPSKEAATCPSSGKSTKLFQPHMEIILSNSASPIPTPNLNISNTNTTSWQQHMSWTLPSNAKDCTIGWSMPAERNFQAGENALVAVYEAGDDDTDAIAKANFAYWPETEGARTNIVSTVECKEDMAFRLQMAQKDSVFLEQNEETGWWVEFSC